MNDIEKCCCSEYIKKDIMLKLSFTNETYSIYGNLNKGDKVILKYFGKLLINETSENTKIFFNYGYGNLWTDKNALEMVLCCHSDKKCYCSELELINTENLFFCFIDNNNNWDLNESSSYMITIDTPITTLIKKPFAVTIQDEDSMSATSNFLKKLTTKLMHLFASIGSLFDKKIKL
ncbi:MAG: hypothetical protein PHD15_00580 [Clostridia bacterium]|nr:hypothetical protein [Clostridia bacterium]MDD4386246.1 hypothetical protein [Clostridia bacterium]